jgi:hypothetical protein
MDISNRLPAFSLVEHLWSPLAKWYAHSAETTSEGTLEQGMTDLAAGGDPEASAESRIDPERALWNELLEEALADGEPKVVLPDLELTDTVWQKKTKEKKRKAAEKSAEDESGITRSFLSEYAHTYRTLTAHRGRRSGGQEGQERYLHTSIGLKRDQC